MADATSSIFVDQDVASRILRILSEAQKNVVMVTPFLKLWRHAQLEIEKAVKRGVQVCFIIRNDSDVTGSEDAGWLRSNGVKVLAVDGLHAKIYLNESTVVISSMNMTVGSTTNSFEIGCVVQDKRDAQALRDYVFKSLAMVAKPLDANAHQVTNTSGIVVGGIVLVRQGTGVCIRCEQPIPLDPSRPLCDDCYDSWARYGNVDYEEHYCHGCGRPVAVTYARPLCRACYQEMA
ncbi:MAG: phospholipase D-like domain-containing protein [Chloroflexota bacterium]|nr:phospholipase D-like domain-containing protein [Chloroflexota bacterium]